MAAYGAEPAGENTEDAAREADYDGFDEELGADVEASRAHRHAQAYLAGALCNGYEHDVHDAYAGHKKRESGGDDKDKRDCIHCRRHGFHHFLLGADGEVVVFAGLYLMVLAQNLRYFVDGLVGIFLGDSRCRY